MNKKKDYIEEMEYLKDWGLTILNFLIERRPDFHSFTKPTKDTIANYTIKNSRAMLNGFKLGIDDINDLTKDLSAIDYNDLNKILLDKFGKTIDILDSKIKKKLHIIVKRGNIKTEEEYSIVEDRVSQLSQLSDKSDEISLLNKLLSDYYRSIKR